MDKDKIELVNARKIAGEILQQILDKSISLKEAREKWPSYKGDISLDSAFHALYHFEDDEDIRFKDQKYTDWQIGQIKRIIESFKSGGPLEKDLIEWLIPK